MLDAAANSRSICESDADASKLAAAPREAVLRDVEDFFPVFLAAFLDVFFLDGALLLFLEAAVFFLLTDLDFFLVAIQQISMLRRIDQSIILSARRFRRKRRLFQVYL